MSAVLRGITRLAPALRPPGLPSRAGYTSRVARSPVGTAETIIALGTISTVMLVPAGWFLANIDSFKKRE